MGQLIDLTMPLYEGMPGHPLHGRTPVFHTGTLQHDIYRYMDRRNPYDGEKLSFANEMIHLCGHTGTHMDAPSHADPHAVVHIDDISLDRGYGSAVWLDVSFRFGPAAEVTADDLARAEKDGGSPIQPGDIVLVFTGWSTYAETDPDKYIKEHMGLTRDAADWLRERGIKTLGIDCTTPETVAGAYESPIHMNFLRPRSLGLSDDDYIAIVENLVNIQRIPARRFRFVGAPLPFKDLTGSPIRAFAHVE